MAQTPDIRVRLVPDGDKAVINALRQVRAEAEIAGRAGSGAFSGMASALGSIRGLLGTLGFAATAGALVALTRSATDFADEIRKGSQRVGASAENLSTLAFAAKTADVEFAQLETGMQRMVRSLGELRKGSLAQVDAFDELGLSADDFTGKDSAESFDLIARRLVAIKDETRRVEAAIAIFGRGGANLIPLLNDLGTKGFAKVREEAERMGLVIGGDLAKAAEAANDAMTLMGQQVKGLATQFIAGLAPAVTAAMTTVQDETAGRGAEGMRTFGDAAGKALGFVINGFKLLGTVVSASVGMIGKNIGAIGAVIGATLSGEFTQAGNIIKERVADNTQELVDLAKAFQDGLGKTLFDLANDPPVVDVKVNVKPPGSDETETASAAIQKQIEDKLAQISKKVGADEFSNLDKIAKKRAEIAEEEIKQQQASAETLKARVALTQQAYATEIQLSTAKAAALNAAVDTEVKNVGTRAQLKTEIAKRSNDEQLIAAQGYYSKLLALNTEWVNRYNAAQEAIKSIDREIADNRLAVERTFNDIRKAGMTEAERFSATRREAIELEGQLQKAVAAGNIEDARRLQKELLAAGAELARLGGERVGREFADDATAALEGLLNKQKQAQQATKQTAEQNVQSLAQQLEQAKVRITELTEEGLGDVALKLKLDQPEFDALLASIRDQLVKKPFLINVAANVGGAATGFARGGGVPGIASLTGPDNVFAMLKSGEYVHQVRAVQYYGPEFMDAINNMRLPRLAAGGGVGASGGPTSASAGSVTHLDLTVNRKPLGRVSGSHEAISNLVEMLNEVARGT